MSSLCQQSECKNTRTHTLTLSHTLEATGEHQLDAQLIYSVFVCGLQAAWSCLYGRGLRRFSNKHLYISGAGS